MYVYIYMSVYLSMFLSSFSVLNNFLNLTLLFTNCLQRQGKFNMHTFSHLHSLIIQCMPSAFLCSGFPFLFCSFISLTSTTIAISPVKKNLFLSLSFVKF